MPEYNSKGAWPAIPNHGGLQPKLFPPKVAEANSQSNPNPSWFNSQTSIQPKFFSQKTSCLMGSSPTSSNSHWFGHVKAFIQNNPISINTSPVTVYKAPFTVSSIMFHMQEWCNLARDDVLSLRKTPPLVSFFGWLVCIILFWMNVILDPHQKGRTHMKCQEKIGTWEGEEITEWWRILHSEEHHIVIFYSDIFYYKLHSLITLSDVPRGDQMKVV
jgi:hypothetical protein